MTQEALVYLNEALDYIQEHSVRRERIDWPALRQEVFALAAHAQTPTETSRALERALELLGDHHSFFRDPGRQQQIQEGKIRRAGVYITYPGGIIGIVDPGSSAELAGVQPGDQVETMNSQNFATLPFKQFREAMGGEQLDLTLRGAGKAPSRSIRLLSTVYEALWLPEGRRLAHDIGYLALPGLLVGRVADYRKAYARTAQALIRSVDQVATRGWVIDLRRTVGGGVWPMWVGVGPVLGEGEIASFVGPGEKLTAVYRDGKASMEPEGRFDEEIEDPYDLKYPWPKVAVLTGPLTGSAGEFAALAFRGRPRTHSFGEPTYGLPTGNDSKRLGDGALIALTTHLGADRTGQTYDGPLRPDHPVTIDWTNLGTPDDPVLQAALAWLCTDEAGTENR